MARAYRADGTVVDVPLATRGMIAGQGERLRIRAPDGTQVLGTTMCSTGYTFDVQIDGGKMVLFSIMLTSPIGSWPIKSKWPAGWLAVGKVAEEVIVFDDDVASDGA